MLSKGNLKIYLDDKLPTGRKKVKFSCFICEKETVLTLKQGQTHKIKCSNCGTPGKIKLSKNGEKYKIIDGNLVS